jgi:serine protease Do
MHRALILSIAALLTVPFPRTPAVARAMETGEAAIARKAMVAVVNISTWKVHPPADAKNQARRVKTYASGFIVDANGIIVTNKHVIDGAMDIEVTLSNGGRLPGRVLAAAVMLDLALIKIDVDRPLPVLKWGNSDDLQVGDPVLTIGNPLGIGTSVSAGIISALNRDLGDTPLNSYIQTDSAINHGNSGGPMIDQEGNVVGIDTSLMNPQETGGSIGIGFAIPSDAAKFVISRLLDPIHPKPGWLGITLQDLTPGLSDALGLQGVKGSIIAALDADGPASTAGLRLGDVLTGIDALKPVDARAFMRAIIRLPVGQPVQLTVWRDGSEQAITATVTEWPNFRPDRGISDVHETQAMLDKMPDPGLRLAPLTDAARQQYGINAKLTGALVGSVEVDSEAQDLGIVAGDVIVALQDRLVATPDDVQQAIETAHSQHRPSLAVLVQGKTGARWLSLSVSKDSR